MAGGRAPLMGDEAVVIHFSDGTRNERVIELLRIIDFTPGRHARDMDVTYLVEVIAQSTDDVAIHDLHMVDVVYDSDIWRTDFPANVEAPEHVVEHLVGTIVGGNF